MLGEKLDIIKKHMWFNDIFADYVSSGMEPKIEFTNTWIIALLSNLILDDDKVIEDRLKHCILRFFDKKESEMLRSDKALYKILLNEYMEKDERLRGKKQISDDLSELI